MRNYLAFAILCIGGLLGGVMLSGCSLIEMESPFAAASVKDKDGNTPAAQGGAAASDLLDKAEAVLGDQIIDQKQAATGETVANTVAQGAVGVKQAAVIASKYAPDSWQPYIENGKSGATILLPLALWAAALFRSQKKKAIGLTVELAEKTKGGGALATGLAPKYGMAEALATAHTEAVTMGLSSVKSNSET